MALPVPKAGPGDGGWESLAPARARGCLCGSSLTQRHTVFLGQQWALEPNGEALPLDAGSQDLPGCPEYWGLTGSLRPLHPLWAAAVGSVMQRESPDQGPAGEPAFQAVLPAPPGSQFPCLR